MELDKNANLNASPFFSLEEIYITDISHTSLELNAKTSKGKKKMCSNSKIPLCDSQKFEIQLIHLRKGRTATEQKPFLRNNNCLP